LAYPFQPGGPRLGSPAATFANCCGYWTLALIDLTPRRAQAKPDIRATIRRGLVSDTEAVELAIALLARVVKIWRSCACWNITTR
jgi:hypothetical protein